MKRILTIELGGIVISFSSKIPRLKGFLSERFEPFLTCRKPHFKIVLDYKDNAPEFFGDKLFQVDNRYDILKVKQGYVFKIHPDRKPNRNSLIMLLENSLKQAKLFLPRLKNYSNRNFFDYPLDQLLILSILGAKKGILLHSSAVIQGEKVFVFMGKSGAGKTTISRILNKNGCAILSDDRVIVRKINGKLAVFGTPWSGAGDFFDSRKGCLKKVFFLVHGRKNRLVKLSRQEALAEILICSFIPYWEKNATGQAIDMAAAIVEKTGFYRLEFLPDDSVFDFLETSFSNGKYSRN